MRRSYPDRVRRAVFARVQNGESIASAAINAGFDCDHEPPHYKTAVSWCKRAGVRSKDPRGGARNGAGGVNAHPPKVRELARLLRSHGLSLNEVCAAVNVVHGTNLQPGTVSKWSRA